MLVTLTIFLGLSPFGYIYYTFNILLDLFSYYYERFLFLILRAVLVYNIIFLIVSLLAFGIYVTWFF